MRIDGEHVPSGGPPALARRPFPGLADLPPLYDDWWYVADPATVWSPKPGGLDVAGEHELDVTIACGSRTSSSPAIPS